VKQSLEILDEMRIAAEVVSDMTNEVAVEIFDTCSYI